MPQITIAGPWNASSTLFSVISQSPLSGNRVPSIHFPIKRRVRRGPQRQSTTGNTQGLCDSIPCTDITEVHKRICDDCQTTPLRPSAISAFHTFRRFRITTLSFVLMGHPFRVASLVHSWDPQFGLGFFLSTSWRIGCTIWCPYLRSFGGCRIRGNCRGCGGRGRGSTIWLQQA